MLDYIRRIAGSIVNDNEFYGKHLFAKEFFEKIIAGRKVIYKLSDGMIPAEIAHYKMNEESWENNQYSIIDSSPNARHAKAVNVNTVFDSKRGFVGDFRTTNTSQYAVVPREVLNGRGYFTFSTWVVTTKAASQGLISSAGYSSDNEFLAWIKYDKATPHVKGPWADLPLPSDFKNGDWHHIAYVRNWELNYVYVDGEPLGVVHLPSGNLDVTNIIVGQEQDCRGGCFDYNQRTIALLSDMVIHDAPLSEREIKELYNATLHDKTKALEIQKDEDIIVENFFSSKSDLDSSGIRYYATDINNRFYPRIEGYMSLFYSSYPIGWIEFDIPEEGFAKTIEIEWGNWYSGRAYLYIDDVLVKELGPYSGADKVVIDYTGQRKIKFAEDGIVWIKSIVVTY